MKQLALSESAFAYFYGANRLVAFSASVFEACKAHLPYDIGVLLLSEDGCLHMPDEKAPPSSDRLAGIGAPAGLKAFIVSGKQQSVAETVASWLAEQSGRDAPPVLVVSDKTPAIDALSYLASVMAAEAAAVRQSAAKNETDLATLRRDFERSLINLEKARRVIRGAGYDTRYSTLTVPVGDGVVGPESPAANGEPARVWYALPIDSAGLIGISLHTSIKDGPRAKGRLQAYLYRSADRRLLGCGEISFADMMNGWFYLELERGLQRSFGDAELCLEWHVESGGAVPQLSLSDAVPDRFADKALHSSGGGRVLPAMQIWSGFAPGELLDDHTFMPAIRERRRTSFSALHQYARELQGENTSANLTSRASGQPWVQTHLDAAGASVLAYHHLIPSAAKSVEATCQTDHPSGPPSLYLVAVGGAEPLDHRYIESLLVAARDGGPLSGFDQDQQVVWKIELVAAARPGEIAVDLSDFKSSTGNRDLYVGVLSATGSQEFGWCRWNHLTVEFDVHEGGVERSGYKLAQPQPIRRMRSVKFPEIAEQFEFLSGAARLQKLINELGFSPFNIEEDNGSLQTHPILQDVSAGLYRSGARAGTTRVACDVETAHERAPNFIYIVALVPARLADKKKIFHELAAAIKASGNRISRGFDQKTGVHYCARQLAALEVSMVAIDLDEPLAEDHDIIVGALPVHDIVSYGWCRWVSLNISSSLDAQPKIDLSASPK